MNLYRSISSYLKDCENSFKLIPEKRIILLKEFSEYISQKLKKSEVVNITFICTHNSRRSHFAQIWMQTTASFYGIKKVHCFSGGTEATAFNPRAVKALQKAGFDITKKDKSENPVYFVQYSEDLKPIKCFSKTYNNPFNPQKNYAAIITCSDADENCPVVFGADARFPIRYEDPKKFDDTHDEEKMYDERCKQIATEMLLVCRYLS
ncbi:MAG: protein-tyrosine-phosphatase [Ignavibacteria bacterium]|nr:protein-tyrosine-phosphatase [Ignavibacteria bacterium]